MPTKQTGKKQSKGTVKSDNGFLSVAYKIGRKEVVWEFINRKDLGCVGLRLTKRSVERATAVGRRFCCPYLEQTYEGIA